ncbi:hypothetical protein GCM10009570_03620 [Dietzia natronolimnaea]
MAEPTVLRWFVMGGFCGGDGRLSRGFPTGVAPSGSAVATLRGGGAPTGHPGVHRPGGWDNLSHTVPNAEAVFSRA